MTDHDRPPGPEGGPIAETIARVRELDAAATKGPWSHIAQPKSSEYLTSVFGADDTEVFYSTAEARRHEHANAALAAEFRAAAPALATALEAAMAENERLRTELEMIRDAAADAIRDNEHVGFTVRTLHVLRAIKLEETR